MRVRIAPSPTGDPHVGTAYTALFNFVAAKQAGGQFVLRIEDTDQSRKVETSESMIFETLKWLGLEWDEGPDCGGKYGPYRQSERLSIYKEYCEKLVTSGAAYPCFCSVERLDGLRKKQKENKEKTRYDRHCCKLSAEEVSHKLSNGDSHVIRLKIPDGSTSFKDSLRDEITFEHKELDDQVLLKADGFPTYHLANVVDDHLMEITHVIRAEEWLSSTPKHEILYQAFGWSPPVWVHLPLLRNPNKSKISKRKNPVSLNFYRDVGILPQTLINFLALMGWNPGGDVEKFGLKEMADQFNLEKIHLGSPVFDWEKLLWLNQQYLKEVSDDEFLSLVKAQVSDEKLLALKPLVIERMQKTTDFFDKNTFFFTGDLDYGGIDILPKDVEKKVFKKALTYLVELWDNCHYWQEEEIEVALKETLEQFSLKPKHLFLPIRLIVSGRKDSPPLVPMISCVGREIVRFRIRRYITALAQ